MTMKSDICPTEQCVFKAKKIPKFLRAPMVTEIGEGHYVVQIDILAAPQQVFNILSKPKSWVTFRKDYLKEVKFVKDNGRIAGPADFATAPTLRLFFRDTVPHIDLDLGVGQTYYKTGQRKDTLRSFTVHLDNPMTTEEYRIKRRSEPTVRLTYILIEKSYGSDYTEEYVLQNNREPMITLKQLAERSKPVPEKIQDQPANPCDDCLAAVEFKPYCTGNPDCTEYSEYTRNKQHHETYGWYAKKTRPRS